jgi:hypothetical protein
VEEAFQAGISLSTPGAQKLAETLDLIEYFQSSQYPFQDELAPQHFILTRPFLTAKEL